MSTYKVKAREGQSIIDVNLMYYSDLNSVVKFCKDNSVDGLNDMDMSGRTLEFDTNNNSNVTNTTLLNQRGTIFKTGSFIGDVLLFENGDFFTTESGYLIGLEQ